MINPEDINVLVDYLRGETVDDKAIDRITKKLELIKKQLDIQESQRQELLKIREDLEALDKEDK